MRGPVNKAIVDGLVDRWFRSIDFDLLPPSRTNAKVVKYVNQEKDGHKEGQIIGFLKHAGQGALQARRLQRCNV